MEWLGEGCIVVDVVRLSCYAGVQLELVKCNATARPRGTGSQGRCLRVAKTRAVPHSVAQSWIRAEVVETSVDPMTGQCREEAAQR